MKVSFQFNDISLKIYVRCILNTCKLIKEFLYSIFFTVIVKKNINKTYI